MVDSTRRQFVAYGISGWVLCLPLPSLGAEVPTQPVFANLTRLAATLEGLGHPLPDSIARSLTALAARGDATAVALAMRLLEPLTLLDITIGADGDAVPHGRAAPARLVEQSWQPFIARVHNPAGLRQPLYVALDLPRLDNLERGSRVGNVNQRQGEQTPARALDLVTRAKLVMEPYRDPPLGGSLSGLEVEYTLVCLVGFIPGDFRFSVKAGAFDPIRSSWWPMRTGELVATVAPANEVALHVLDHDGRGTMASITVRDAHNRVYPSKLNRIAPDMFFQDQVYRADGETFSLPDGGYSVMVARGPEYEPLALSLKVSGAPSVLEAKLRRWVDPAARGWYSGDVHIHAAGCSHYSEPSIGVSPQTMARHVRGEGLWIGEVLTWGPGYDEQKKNFSGHVAKPDNGLENPALQRAHGTTLQPRVSATDDDSLLRYDVEVSGFPSSHTGHLILMRLRDQNFPGTRGPADWPSWSLPILQWAKAQGAVTGFAHCGHGITGLGDELPSLRSPSFEGIGANEYLIDVVHGLVDFLAGGDCPPQADLVQWYHALNCGFRTALAGETDWPCMSDMQVGMARTYVKLDQPPRTDAGYDAWVGALASGEAYMGDGRAHLLDFTVDGVPMGQTVALSRRGQVAVRATVAARLDVAAPETPMATLASSADPRWHLERARIAGTRSVAAELIVNGKVSSRHIIIADGREQTIESKIHIPDSAWIALRIYPALHGNPVFVSVSGRPVRASRASAEWCVRAIGILETTLLPRIAAEKRLQANAAFAHATDVFRRIVSECRA